MSLVILGSNAETLDALARAAESLPAARGRGLRLERISIEGGVVKPADAQSAVAAARELNPDSLIGFVADDEPAVLAALAGGADEAAVMVFPRAAAQTWIASHLIAFIDRVEVRGKLRADRQRLQISFLHAAKLTALGTLVAGISHEINNPLSSVLLSLFVLRNKLVPAVDAALEVADALAQGVAPSAKVVEQLKGLRAGRDVPALLDDVSSAAQGIASIVRDLRTFAQEDDQEAIDAVDVPELLDRVARLLKRDIALHGVLERDYARGLPAIAAPRNRLAQVFTNLLSNAVHAIAEAPPASHAIRISVRTDDDFLLIAISDTGPGIPQEAVERIFDPFFSTKRKELGTGLGLSISRSIVRNLGGDLAVESVYGEGATFFCTLPLARADTLTEAHRSGEQDVGREPIHAQTVLVVDSDPQMLRAYARVLGAAHRLIVARDEREAMELIEAGSQPDAIVIELDLPGLGAHALVAWLRLKRPALAQRVALVTSFDAEQRHAATLQLHRGPVLQKPMRGEALLRALAELEHG